jgi:CRP/FNR family cyclic AMP-dependent transcriptional regulator
MAEAIAQYLEHARMKTVPARTTLIRAGEVPECLYYIVSGSVEVMLEDDQGSEMVLSYLEAGEFFGELGYFRRDAGRTAWVRTRTDCELAEMRYPRFEALAAQYPVLLFDLARQIAARIERTNEKVTDLAFMSVSGRVAKALMDLSKTPEARVHEDGEGVEVQISRQELARLVGCSREMAGRVLKSLEAQGLIDASRTSIIVYDVHATA